MSHWVADSKNARNLMGGLPFAVVFAKGGPLLALHRSPRHDCLPIPFNICISVTT